VPAWSEALIAYFIEAATDLEDAGLGADDVRQVAEAAARHMIDPTHPSQRSPGFATATAHPGAIRSPRVSGHRSASGTLFLTSIANPVTRSWASRAASNRRGISKDYVVRTTQTGVDAIS
jgi:hypothetical protein